MIGIIDYHLGNISSIINIYKAHSIDVKKIDTPEKLNDVFGIILPGVGSFDNAIKLLKKKKLFQGIRDIVLKKNIPILGICIGMHLLCNKSEEGKEEGLSLLNIDIKKIKEYDKNVLVPHMGWNNVNIEKNNFIFDNIDNQKKFYFLHSFCCKDANKENTLGTTFYGETFNSVVFNNNIYGIQFHPEKSHTQGEQILLNFKRVCF